MSTDETRPLPADQTQPLPADQTQPLPADQTQPLPAGGTRPLPVDAGTGTAHGADRTDHTADADLEDGTAATTAPRRDRVRVGTIVWGVVIALLGVGVLLVAAGYTIDLELAAIGLLVVAGLGLIVGPLVASARRRGEDAGGARR